MPIKRVLAIIAGLVLAVLVTIPVTYVMAIYYVESRMNVIFDRGSTRAIVEENKGLLFAREISLEQLGAYGRGLVLEDGQEIVRYWFLGAYFTVVYDASGESLIIFSDGT